MAKKKKKGKPYSFFYSILLSHPREGKGDEGLLLLFKHKLMFKKKQNLILLPNWKHITHITLAPNLAKYNTLKVINKPQNKPKIPVITEKRHQGPCWTFGPLHLFNPCNPDG